MVRSRNKFLGKGIYTISEAARLTGAGRDTISRWLLGYSYKRGGKFYERPPIFTTEFGDVDGQFTISFQDLIELLFVAKFRAKGVKWSIIHEAFKLARERFESEHPFSAINFKTDGQRIFEETIIAGAVQLADLHLNQIVIADFIAPTLTKAIEFDTRRATIWYPQFPSKLILLDPQRSFGRPIVSRGSVPTEALYLAYEAEEDFGLVARQFDLKVADVRSAVKFQERLAA
ncbi:hypothetical protein [uncultured Tateyamaria sp.]|uniref:hypothetical protein n=1 Tax=uncultured Tateyamaria sp. TaxID=455651 RepID=UPI002639C496|nr:hypothetical protein [uncultured Tateyamaria sp.]